MTVQRRQVCEKRVIQVSHAGRLLLSLSLGLLAVGCIETRPINPKNSYFEHGTVILARIDSDHAVIGADGLVQRRNPDTGVIALMPSNGPKALICGPQLVCAGSGLLSATDDFSYQGRRYRGQYQFDSWLPTYDDANREAGESPAKAFARLVREQALNSFETTKIRLQAGAFPWDDHELPLLTIFIVGH